jgi:membrane-associated phospholipid phosphatase
VRQTSLVPAEDFGMRRQGVLAAFRRLGIDRALAVIALFAGIAPYVYLRGIADDTPIPHQRLVEAVEMFLAGGTLPSAWLQQWFHTPGAVGTFDQFWLFFYGLWLPSGFFGAVWFALRRWDHFGRFSIAWFVLFYGALIPFLLVPTEPPWLLGDVERVFALATELPRIDTNQVAAMPSLHVAMPAMIAFRARASGMRWMAAIWGAFAALTAFAVIYLGEHFILDTVAGFAFAWLAVRVSQLREVPVASSREVPEMAATSASPRKLPRAA